MESMRLQYLDALALSFFVCFENFGGDDLGSWMAVSVDRWMVEELMVGSVLVADAVERSIGWEREIGCWWNGNRSVRKGCHNLWF